MSSGSGFVAWKLDEYNTQKDAFKEVALIEDACLGVSNVKIQGLYINRTCMYIHIYIYF